MAAEVDLPGKLPPTRLTDGEVARLDRASTMLLLAAHEAWQQAGWEASDDLPLVLGTTAGGMSLGEAYYPPGRANALRASPSADPRVALPGAGPGPNRARRLGFSGPISIISNACASGANAIGHAWELIRSRPGQRALTGGYDALSQLVFAGFDSLQTLSPTACRPFDARRDGLAIGEGAAIVALETLDERAPARGRHSGRSHRLRHHHRRTPPYPAASGR